MTSQGEAVIIIDRIGLKLNHFTFSERESNIVVMTEIRRTEGGLIINDNKPILVTVSPEHHGLVIPDAEDIEATNPFEALENRDIFFKGEEGICLALAVLPRSDVDRLHIFPGQDMWRTYFEYYSNGSIYNILISHAARLMLEGIEITTSHRTGISDQEIEMTNEQHSAMVERQAEAEAEEELRGLDFDEGISSLLADNNE